MKENQDYEIGSNMSSGAEKVETVVENNATSIKNSPSQEEKRKREEAAAKARVEAAMHKQQAKTAREERRKTRLEELRAQERAELAYLEEKRRHRQEGREEHARERAHEKANKTRQKQQGGGRKEYGGWLAAVVSLGVATLILTTALVVGAIEMSKTKDGVMSGYKSTTYELMGIMENVDNDLDRARISASTSQQDRILTDLLVQARLAELDFEKLPVEMQKEQSITRFINRVAEESERMLTKLRKGEKLSQEDRETLENLYSVNHSIRAELAEFSEKLTDKDLRDFIDDGKGMIADVMDRIEKVTLPENKIESRGAGMRSNEKQAPMDEMKSVDPAKAEQLCRQYFEGYKIQEFQCVGETVGEGYRAYNVQGYDDNGTLLLAQLSQKDGVLLRFDYYEECQGQRFDDENAEDLAEEFLERLGYDDMEAVRGRKNGTNLDFTFVYEMDDVLFYPDTVHVKVCQSRGVVTGFDGVQFYKNHKTRSIPQVQLSMEKAKARLHDALRVDEEALTVIQTKQGERAAYEFLCSYQDERYLVYIDALSGEEISIVNVKNIG